MAVGGARVRNAFKAWDTTGSGLIPIDQLSTIITRLSPDLQKHDLDSLFSAAGASNKESGNLHYDDFLHWLWSSSCPVKPAEDSQRSFGLSANEEALERARERGLWQDALTTCRRSSQGRYAAHLVNQYFDNVQARLVSDEYIVHVTTTFFNRTDVNKDGRIDVEEATVLISKCLHCVADLGRVPEPTAEEIREAFDAHDTLVAGRGYLGGDEFLNLARYLQVRVAEAALPLSSIIHNEA